MPDEKLDAAQKLRKLGNRLRMSKLAQPPDKKARAKLLDFVRNEWPKTQRTTEKQEPAAAKDIQNRRKGPTPKR